MFNPKNEKKTAYVKFWNWGLFEPFFENKIDNFFIDLTYKYLI
jgi:hypothetical protein